MGFLSPHAVNIKNGKIVSVTFARNEQTNDGQWVKDEDQLTTLKANYLISAFGSGLEDQDSKLGRETVKYENFFRPVIFHSWE